MKKIKTNMTFGEILSEFPKVGAMLADRGLFCGGCPMAQLETIGQGAKAHGLDPKKLIKELNQELEKNE
jgi:hybrid cluster-associated redox disulfide protein